MLEQLGFITLITIIGTFYLMLHGAAIIGLFVAEDKKFIGFTFSVFLMLLVAISLVVHLTIVRYCYNNSNEEKKPAQIEEQTVEIPVQIREQTIEIPRSLVR